MQDDETPLHIAAHRGHFECVETLVESGALLDEKDQNGQTALHLALRRRHSEIALFLINKGSNLTICDNVSYLLYIPI